MEILVFTITGRRNWYVVQPNGRTQQVDADVASDLMHNGMPVEYR